jgi:5'-3' exonuclease
VVGNRVVQMDRRGGRILDAEGVRRKYGVEPPYIPDFLALVGDSADGYQGIGGIGRVTAARLVQQYGAIEQFPSGVLGEQRELALLFKNLATLRSDAPLFEAMDQLEWHGPGSSFPAWAERLGDARLLERARKAAR